MGMGSTDSCMSGSYAATDNDQNIGIRDHAIVSGQDEVLSDQIKIHDSPCEADDEMP